MTRCAILLRDKSRLLEGFINPWIKLNGCRVIFCESVISHLASFHHPLLERFSNKSVNNIADVRPWHLADLFHDWESINDFSE